tara:strand:- start:224 stop:556 length:333 start_codon:yes stop_codon:yes gene_type:complete
MTIPIVGYKRSPPPILKKKNPIRVSKIPSGLAPLELPSSTQEKYMEDELRRIENTLVGSQSLLYKAQSPSMSVTNFTVTRTVDGANPNLGTTTDALLTLIQDLKDSGVIS